MDHRKAIQTVVVWTLTLVLVFTAVITALSLLGWVAFINEDKQQKLFYALIVEVTVVGVVVNDNYTLT